MSLRPPTEAGHGLDRRQALAILLGIVVLALVLRLWGITAQSLWWDEVMSFRQARLGLADLIAVTAEDNYPPLYNLILHATMLVLGETEFALRLPSAVLGVGAVLATYWVGSLLGGRAAGLIAALLLTVSGFHLWYSNEARMYALLCCAAVLFAGTTVRWLTTPTWRWAVLNILAGTALLYSHAYGALTWVALGGAGAAILLLRRDYPGLVRTIGLHAALAALFAPWALVTAMRAGELSQQGFWIPPVTAWAVVQHLVQLLSGPFMLAAVAIGIRLTLAPAPATPLIQPEPAALSRRETLILLLSWAVVPLALGIVLSLLLAPVLISRYLIGSLPAFLILTGLGFARLSQGRSGYLAIGFLGVAALSGLLLYLPPQRDDFRAVAAHLRTALEPGDCLVMIPEAAFALRYYYADPLPCLKTARHFADISFETPPNRILVLGTLDADLPGIPALGTEIGTTAFGPTTLIALRPHP